MVAKDGEREVKLVRQFGNEKITVSFGIVPEEHSAMDDDDESIEEDGEEYAEDIDTALSFTITIDVTKQVRVHNLSLFL